MIYSSFRHCLSALIDREARKEGARSYAAMRSPDSSSSHDAYRARGITDQKEDPVRLRRRRIDLIDTQDVHAGLRCRIIATGRVSRGCKVSRLDPAAGQGVVAVPDVSSSWNWSRGIGAGIEGCTNCLQTSANP